MSLYVSPFMSSCAALLSFAAISAPAQWQRAVRPVHALDGEIHATHLHPENGGHTLYAAGSFQSDGSVLLKGIARYDRGAWSPLGDGLNAPGYALETFDDGSGPSLFVGGWFNSPGGERAYDVARWDGTSWHSVGGGMNNGVFDLAVFDDGAGPDLYAAGFFTEDRRRSRSWSGPLGRSHLVAHGTIAHGRSQQPLRLRRRLRIRPLRRRHAWFPQWRPRVLQRNRALSWEATGSRSVAPCSVPSVRR